MYNHCSRSAVSGVTPKLKYVSQIKIIMFPNSTINTICNYKALTMDQIGVKCVYFCRECS